MIAIMRKRDVPSPKFILFPYILAGMKGLEPSTSCVTGRRSNRLSYIPRIILVGDPGIEPGVRFRDGFTVRCHTL